MIQVAGPTSDAPSRPPPMTVAERLRAMRARRRAGKHPISFVLSPIHIAALVRLGFLRAQDRRVGDAIDTAFVSWLARSELNSREANER
jgi:hypothetical protein